MSGTGLDRAVLGARGCESRSYKMYSFKPQEQQFFNKQKQLNRMRIKLALKKLDEERQEYLDEIARMEYKCVLCDGVSHGYGNNPDPLADASCPSERNKRCCDDCNLKVIRARLYGMTREQIPDGFKFTKESCQPKTQRC
tara:strand:- start:1487 stop:1906 length:420 start_codon:yes stop_codon:yes gene_type:complete